MCAHGTCLDFTQQSAKQKHMEEMQICRWNLQTFRLYLIANCQLKSFLHLEMLVKSYIWQVTAQNVQSFLFNLKGKKVKRGEGTRTES